MAFQKLTLQWESDKNMRALFSNRNTDDESVFRLLMVFHKSEKGGFDREISEEECDRMLRKANPAFRFEFQVTPPQKEVV